MREARNSSSFRVRMRKSLRATSLTHSLHSLAGWGGGSAGRGACPRTWREGHLGTHMLDPTWQEWQEGEVRSMEDTDTLDTALYILGLGLELSETRESRLPLTFW